MDKKHIGTDATMTEHIQTIQNRAYAQQVAREFVPLPVGMALVPGHESMRFDFAKPQLKWDTEQTMLDVAGRAKDFEREMKRRVDYHEDSYDRVEQQVHFFERSFQREMPNAPQPRVANPQQPRGGARGGEDGLREMGNGRTH
jgi:DNA topoisomerase-3